MTHFANVEINAFFTLFRNVEFHALVAACKILETSRSLNSAYAPNSHNCIQQ